MVIYTTEAYFSVVETFDALLRKPWLYVEKRKARPGSAGLAIIVFTATSVFLGFIVGLKLNGFLLLLAGISIALSCS